MLPKFKYKGYTASVECEGGLFYGEVDNTEELLYFEGTTIPEAYQSFVEAVDAYLGE